MSPDNLCSTCSGSVGRLYANIINSTQMLNFLVMCSASQKDKEKLKTDG
uniref:Uncharacterized protein n=1 Tax=Arundo donax TaxID=35708 RepID=A0A0A9A893_ARUDO